MTEDAHDLVCSRCGQEPALPYHAYGRLCLNAAKREWRRKLRERMLAYEAELLAASFGKTVSRQILQDIEKRRKG
jgi:hypothetical protein